MDSDGVVEEFGSGGEGGKLVLEMRGEVLMWEG